MDSIKFVIQTDFDELNGYSDAVIDYKGVEANKPLYQYRPCEKKELEVVMPLSFIYTKGTGFFLSLYVVILFLQLFRTPFAKSPLRGFLFCICMALNSYILTLQIGQFFQQSIGYGNDTAVGLETSLSGEHRSKLGRQVYITHLQLTGGHVSTACGDVYADTIELTGVQGCRVKVVSLFLQTGGIGKCCGSNLA